MNLIYDQTVFTYHPFYKRNLYLSELVPSTYTVYHQYSETRLLNWWDSESNSYILCRYHTRWSIPSQPQVSEYIVNDRHGTQPSTLLPGQSQVSPSEDMFISVITLLTRRSPFLSLIFSWNWTGPPTPRKDLFITSYHDRTWDLGLTDTNLGPRNQMIETLTSV